MSLGATLQEVVKWSEERPPWQRDALRRLVEFGSLTTADDEELLALCRTRHGLVPSDQPAPQATPLTAEHVPAAAGRSARTELVAIGEVLHVNALAEGQELLFGDSGLTVIYGGNGSGKSGYARILRKACRARARGGRILPNVFRPTPTEPASASIRFRVDGTEDEFRWIDGQPAVAELSRIGFFDSECAAVHVDQANEVAYRPRALDLLEELAGACRRLKERLVTELEEHESAQPPALREPQARPTTAVGKTLRGLSKDTAMPDVEKLATLSGKEKERLEVLRQTLIREEPAAQAKRLQSQRERLQSLFEMVTSASAALSPDAVQKLKVLSEEATTARQAARIAASDLFSGEPLPGIGSEIWRLLWDAARRYSEGQAYPREAFPVTREGSLCVLCQQPLGEAAANRLGRFEEFVRADVERKAQSAEAALQHALDGLGGLDLRRAVYLGVINEIGAEDPSLADSVRRYVVVARWRRRFLLRAHPLQDWETLPELPTSPVDDLVQLIEAAGRRIEEVRAAGASETRRRLEEERAELEDRAWLGSVLDDVRREIVRLDTLSRLEKAIQDTDTTLVTRKNSELAEQLVTSRLTAAFGEELERLGVSLLVELVPAGGRYGAPRYRINLEQEAEPGVKAGQVLSEGEYRVIALAGFLAELATAEDRSAIVLDDPVSSLDHRWRRKVAGRLAEESNRRQVVVFTHDLVFVLGLVEEARREAVAQSVVHLRGRSGRCGVPSAGLPWDAKNVNKRIGELRKDQQRLEADLKQDQDHRAYEAGAAGIYRRLRSSWERGVEEVLLGGAVQRFDFGVHTQQLRKLDDITQEDLRAVERGMSKCSRFLHDSAPDVNEPIPEPDEIWRDIDELKEWVGKIRNRR